jgi:hypothetical protein
LERISSPSLAVHYPRRTSASLVVLRPSLICAICLKVTFIILLISFSASSFHPTLGLLLGCLWYRLSCYILCFVDLHPCIIFCK